MVDGRRLFSYCEDLTSCYSLTGDGGESTSDYEFDDSGDCNLDEANGYDFTD